MLNCLYEEAYLVDSQAADAIWESWWAGDMTGYAVGLAWWAITDDEKYGELDFFGTRLGIDRDRTL